MKKRQLLTVLLLMGTFFYSVAQQTEIKKYAKNTKAGEVYVLSNYGELASGVSTRVYTIDVPRDKNYYINVLANMQLAEKFKVLVDGSGVETIYGTVNGWQYRDLKYPVPLLTGKHTITFVGSSVGVPMVEEITLSTTPPVGRNAIPAPVSEFIQKTEQLRQQPLVRTPTVDEAGDLTNKVLPNPLGLYDHAIDTTFGYSHYSWVYLTAGYHNFSTINSTAHRSLTVFNPLNYTYSWANVNGGLNGESELNLYVALAGYYSIMLRPYTSSSGLTNIVLDGATLVSNAIIGGRTYAMSVLKGGPLNFFTCRLNGGDTRMIASKYFASSARAVQR